ncbi:MAG: c-type cytochrome [Myxococcota bacterium]
MRICLVLAGLIGACAAPEIPETPLGSSSVVGDTLGQRLAVANAFEDTLSIVNLGAVHADSVDVGVEPTRVAIVHGRALVTLRGERGIAEVDLATARVLAVHDTGPEPYGILAHPDGQRVYVSVSLGDVIEERDALSLQVLRTFSVPNEPRWLAVHPTGRTLVVGSARGSVMHAIDLDSGTVGELALPTHVTEAFGSAVQGEVELASRVTGDPVFSTDGTELVVPTLYVDHRSGEMGPAETNLQVPVPSAPYYRQAPVVDSMGRFNSAIVHYDVDEDDGNIALEAAATSRIIDVAPGMDGQGSDVRQSYLTSLTQSPDGLGWLATMESSDAVLFVDGRYKKTWKRRTRLAFPMVSVVSTGRGPRGLAVLGGRSVFVHEAHDRTVADVVFRKLRKDLRQELDRGLEAEFDDDGGSPTAHSMALAGIELTERVLDPNDERGRSLFYSATSTTMGEAGVSCSTCHFEGRTDGLTWELFNGPRNTPSLAGPVASAGVVTWTNPVETVAEEAGFTVEHRMGADVLSTRMAESIESFVESTPLPDLPDVNQDAIDRGRQVFEREDVACASCHSGEYLTDGQAYPMFGLDSVKTRPLHGIASSPPYLHDGRAQTLRDVLEMSRNGAMGNTGGLTDGEMSDLEAYLRSL